MGEPRDEKQAVKTLWNNRGCRLLLCAHFDAIFFKMKIYFPNAVPATNSLVQNTDSENHMENCVVLLCSL